LGETSSEQLQLDKELWGDSEGEEETTFVWPDFIAAYLQGLLHRHVHCWTKEETQPAEVRGVTAP
jgi:hypothetical protein